MLISSVFMIIIVCFIVFDYLLENGLELLNARYASPDLPEELECIYNKENYTKSLNYQKDNRTFSYISSTFMLVLTLTFFLAGGFGFVDSLLRNCTQNPILLVLLYFGCIGLALDLISTPFSWYHTFVIEQKFGFNKMTSSLFWFDKLKSIVLICLLGGGILSLITWIYMLSPTWFWLIAWASLAFFSLFMSMFYSQLIVPLFNKQTPLPEGELRIAIEEFCIKAGFKLNNIFVIDGSKRSSKSNAYFTGFGSKKRIVLYDTLVQNHTTDELVAVLAHEVGHNKKRHTIIGLFISLAQSLLMFFLLGLFLNNLYIAEAMGAKQASFHINIIAFGLLYSPISLLFGLTGNIFSRRFEYAADAYAVENTSAIAMGNALKKLSADNLSNLRPHPLYVFFHYSHPTTLQRLEKIGMWKNKKS